MVYPEDKCSYRAVRTRKRGGGCLPIGPSEKHPFSLSLSQSNDKMRKVLAGHLAFLHNISHSGFTEHLPLMKPVLDASALGGLVSSLGTTLSLPFWRLQAVGGCQVSGAV